MEKEVTTVKDALRYRYFRRLPYSYYLNVPQDHEVLKGKVSHNKAKEAW